jgi:hypothetical protein
LLKAEKIRHLDRLTQGGAMPLDAGVEDRFGVLFFDLIV